MSVAAIGEHRQIAGYGLAGVTLYPASDRDSAVSAWDDLPADVELLILSATAYDTLRARLTERPVIWLELPG